MWQLLEALLRRRMAVGSGALALVLFGAVAWSRLPIDAFPDLTNQQVMVLTEVEGLGPAVAEPHSAFLEKVILAAVDPGTGTLNEEFAEAHGEVDQLQVVEETEGLRFATPNLESHHCARRNALTPVDLVLGTVLGYVPEIMDLLYLGVVGQEVGHVAGVLHLRGHPQLERLEAAQNEPARPRA